MNEATYAIFRPDLERATLDDFRAVATAMHLQPAPYIEAEDVSNAVLFLACDEARYITGVARPR